MKTQHNTILAISKIMGNILIKIEQPQDQSERAAYEHLTEAARALFASCLALRLIDPDSEKITEPFTRKAKTAVEPGETDE